MMVVSHSFDDMFGRGGVVLPLHLSYAKDAPQAAQFVVELANGES